MATKKAKSAAPAGDRANAPQRILGMFKTMCLIREFEEAAHQSYVDGFSAGSIHQSIGQEAVAVGVCTNMRPTDMIHSNHRGHGHAIAKGADVTAMMKELFGRVGGTSGGKGGSMHIADFSVGMLGANGVVAAGIPIAVGAAQSAKLRGIDAIAVTFFGDGAINRGPFAEGLNWAASFRLPVLFVCEDNQWSATTRTAGMSAGEGAAARAAAAGVPSETVDGMDVEAVHRAAGRLVAEIRAGGGPRLLHAKTYRFKGHVSVDPATYRDPAEVARAVEGDPLGRTRARLAALGVAQTRIDAAMDDARAEIGVAIETAGAAPWPEPGAAYTDIQDTGAGRWA